MAIGLAAEDKINKSKCGAIRAGMIPCMLIRRITSNQIVTFSGQTSFK